MKNDKGTNGFMTYIGNRGDDLEMRFLKPMFELGRSRIEFYSPRDRDSIAQVIADADVVINCIGKYYGTQTILPICGIQKELHLQGDQRRHTQNHC